MCDTSKVSPQTSKRVPNDPEEGGERKRKKKKKKGDYCIVTLLFRAL